MFKFYDDKRAELMEKSKEELINMLEKKTGQMTKATIFVGKLTREKKAIEAKNNKTIETLVENNKRLTEIIRDLIPSSKDEGQFVSEDEYWTKTKTSVFDNKEYDGYNEES